MDDNAPDSIIFILLCFLVTIVVVYTTSTLVLVYGL